jgi:hypothetical protein
MEQKNNNLIDYKKEVGLLKELSNHEWWKPKAGKHDVILLSNGEPYQWIDKNQKPVSSVRFLVKIGDKEFSWSITKSITHAGLWGQLCLLAESKDSELVGEKITLVAIGEGKNIRYSIVEAAELIPQKKEEVVKAS